MAHRAAAAWCRVLSIAAIFSFAGAVSACGSDVRFPYVWCVLVRFPNGKLYWFELKPDVYLALDGLSHLGPLILEVKDGKPSAVAAAADRWVHRTFACGFKCDWAK